MTPMMVMNIDSTAAKIGRLMKNRLIGIAGAPSAIRARRGIRGLRHAYRFALGLHLLTRPRELQALHDDPVIGRHAFTDNSQSAGQRPEPHGLARNATV